MICYETLIMTNKSILRDDIEYAVQCDEHGTIIGPISKIHAHLPGARQVLTHYSTWSMIFHMPSGRYGIQQKSPKKHDNHSAGKWDMGIAGHNCYIRKQDGYRPMSFSETLIKEAHEEIGLTLVMMHSLNAFKQRAQTILRKPIGYIFDQFHYITKVNNEFVGLGFILTPTTNVSFLDNEVIDFKWLTPVQLKKFLRTETNYCDPLPLVFKKAETFRKRYLKP